jgi:cytosine/adenosine deaminase-related metal-dependent hydrolase
MSPTRYGFSREKAATLMPPEIRREEGKMCESKQKSPALRTETADAEATPRAAEPAEFHGVSRRGFIARSAAGLVAGALGGAGLAGCASPAVRRAPVTGAAGQRVLLKGGVVLTMDPRLGDFEQADVLIEGSKIAAVGPDLQAAGATVIDATHMIVMPGFVDSHRHIWQGPIRNIFPNGTLAQYFKSIGGAARSAYRPEDVYAGNLLSAWSALNAGVTTLLDWSHISNTPEHSDAAVSALMESGIRAVYAYGFGAPGPRYQYPQDVRRLRKQYFASDDQLVTLAFATSLDPNHWRVAREVGAPITVHANGTGELLPLAQAKLMGPDVTYVHCCRLTPEEWKHIADTGGTLSISAPIEMQMGHGIPPIQQALDLKIPLSLSNDVETSTGPDLFTQMRVVFVLQRMQVLARERAGEKNLPPLMNVKQVAEIATLGGAKVNHLERRTGSLTPGKQADVIMLAANRINMMPLNNAYAAIVQAMDTSNVETVFVAGRLKKWRGELVGVDVAKLQAMAERSRDYLIATAKWPRTVLGGYAPGH